jgi:hypothetical protein
MDEAGQEVTSLARVLVHAEQPNAHPHAEPPLAAPAFSLGTPLRRHPGRGTRHHRDRARRRTRYRVRS